MSAVYAGQVVVSVSMAVKSVAVTGGDFQNQTFAFKKLEIPVHRCKTD